MPERGRQTGNLFDFEIRFREDGKCQYARLKVGRSVAVFIALLFQMVIGWKIVPFRSIIERLHLPW